MVANKITEIQMLKASVMSVLFFTFMPINLIGDEGIYFNIYNTVCSSNKLQL